MRFTPEELAEMARADAEIEASFRLTNDDLKLAKELDRAAAMEHMLPEKKKVAERLRAYYEANKDKVAERQRAIARVRREHGLTQADLAKQICVSRATISLWESGALPADWDKLVLALPELKTAPGAGTSESGTTGKKPTKSHPHYKG